MNKQDIKAFKKEMKLDNYKLSLDDMVSAYVKNDGSEGSVLFQNKSNFKMLDLEVQEMYFNNFKKLLPTAIDTKIFDLRFNEEEVKDILLLGVKEDIEGAAEQFIQKFCSCYKYEFDSIVSFVKVKFMQTEKSEDEEEGEESYNYKEFIMISVNKVESPKKALSFDAEEQEFKTNSSLDFIINLNPLEGLTYPSFTGKGNVMYYTGKPKDLSKKYVSELLGVDFTATATEEKADFIQVITEACGSELSIEKVEEIYKELESRIDEEDADSSVVNTREIKTILERKGLDTAKYDKAVEDIESETFKIANLVPEKKVTIVCGDIVITLPKDKFNALSEGSNKLTISLTDEVSMDGIPVKVK